MIIPKYMQSIKKIFNRGLNFFKSALNGKLNEKIEVSNPASLKTESAITDLSSLFSASVFLSCSLNCFKGLLSSSKFEVKYHYCRSYFHIENSYILSSLKKTK